MGSVAEGPDSTVLRHVTDVSSTGLRGHRSVPTEDSRSFSGQDKISGQPQRLHWTQAALWRLAMDDASARVLVMAAGLTRSLGRWFWDTHDAFRHVSGFLGVLGFCAEGLIHTRRHIGPSSLAASRKTSSRTPSPAPPAGCFHQILSWKEPEIHLNLNSVSREDAGTPTLCLSVAPGHPQEYK